MPLINPNPKPKPKKMKRFLYRGLVDYGTAKTIKEIQSDLTRHPEIKDPKRLAVWIRKQALGDLEFERHKKMARRSKISKKLSKKLASLDVRSIPKLKVQKLASKKFYLTKPRKRKATALANMWRKESKLASRAAATKKKPLTREGHKQLAEGYLTLRRGVLKGE